MNDSIFRRHTGANIVILIQTYFYPSFFLDMIYSDGLTDSHKYATLLPIQIPVSQLQYSYVDGIRSKDASW